MILTPSESLNTIDLSLYHPEFQYFVEHSLTISNTYIHYIQKNATKTNKPLSLLKDYIFLVNPEKLSDSIDVAAFLKCMENVTLLLFKIFQIDSCYLLQNRKATDKVSLG